MDNGRQPQLQVNNTDNNKYTECGMQEKCGNQ